MNVSIRPLKVSDAKVSWRWRNDPIVWKFTGSRPNIAVTEKIETEWIKRVINEKDSARFAIVITSNGLSKYVGNVQLTNILSSKAQYHIFIGSTSYWGKGIARIATNWILDFARGTLRLKHVWLSVSCDNVRAISLYSSIGFVISCRTKSHLTMHICLNDRH